MTYDPRWHSTNSRREANVLSICELLVLWAGKACEVLEVWAKMIPILLPIQAMSRSSRHAMCLFKMSMRREDRTAPNGGVYHATTWLDINRI